MQVARFLDGIIVFLIFPYKLWQQKIPAIASHRSLVSGCLICKQKWGVDLFSRNVSLKYDITVTWLNIGIFIHPPPANFPPTLSRPKCWAEVLLLLRNNIKEHLVCYSIPWMCSFRKKAQTLKGHSCIIFLIKDRVPGLLQ